MRKMIVVVSVGSLLLSAGCNWFHANVLNKSKQPQQTALNEKPAPEDLIAYLNGDRPNVVKVNSLQVTDLAIEAKMGLGVARSIELRGTLLAQGPRNFRMEGKIPGAGTEVVDLGSNDHEFWFWVAQNNPPYLFYCSHSDLPRARLPLPIHPDWIMEALGMAHVTPSRNFRVELPRGGNSIELIEDTTSPQGQRMQKVTVFNSRTMSGKEPQVISRRLVDHQGKVICEAVVKEMQQDQRTRAMVPKRMDLIYPGDRTMDKITLSLVLDTIAVNLPIDQSMAWFTRPDKPGVKSFDLGNVANTSPSFRNSPGGVVPSGGSARGSLR
jgi:hypothetical protein